MFVLVLAAEADETRQAITFLIVCLVGIAALLSLLTVWYWRYTSPGKRAEVPASVVGGATACGPGVGLADAIEQGDVALAAAQGSVGAPTGPPGPPVPVGEAGKETGADEPSSDPRQDRTNEQVGAGIDVGVDVDESSRRSLVVSSRRERIEVAERSSAPNSATRIEFADRVLEPQIVAGQTSPVSFAPDPAVADRPESKAKAGAAVGVSSGPAAPDGAARPMGKDSSEAGPTGDGLSDDAWAAAMKSAFDKLQG